MFHAKGWCRFAGVRNQLSDKRSLGLSCKVTLQYPILLLVLNTVTVSLTLQSSSFLSKYFPFLSCSSYPPISAVSFSVILQYASNLNKYFLTLFCPRYIYVAWYFPIGYLPNHVTHYAVFLYTFSFKLPGNVSCYSKTVLCIEILKPFPWRTAKRKFKISMYHRSFLSFILSLYLNQTAEIGQTDW